MIKKPDIHRVAEEIIAAQENGQTARAWCESAGISWRAARSVVGDGLAAIEMATEDGQDVDIATANALGQMLKLGWELHKEYGNAVTAELLEEKA